ncbi:aminoacyl-tRNA hydrolase [Bacillus kwashiorkori]|uniref:aminoacyl-tRNA hydrolase n=1 Tax=Bacillus kwashiorkori TaxID=1522318 RepID=UPI000785CB0C|nr:aminoacyl-tRNA hydrolase [Bacillus kwashiorkori]
MKLIVGLGNPGKQYEKTRHNIGFKVIDELSTQFNLPLTETKFRGLYSKGIVNGEKVILLKPMTYMNLSGEAVKPLMEYFQISIDDLLVVYDELDLPVGKIRLRYKGSAGGHNGIKSLIAHLGTQEFKRIRIGIDRPEPGFAITDYVLGKFSKQEAKVMQEVMKKCVEACETWLKEPFLDVMNKYNQ